MNDLATARADFLARVEGYASGQAVRFTPPLDELIAWSATNGLAFMPHAGVNDLVKFADAGATMAFWSVTPRTGDGAKFTLLNDSQFPEALRTLARDELSDINRKAAQPKGVPEVAFTKLIWPPYRQRVMDLMARLLDGVRRPGAASESALTGPGR
jgi:hypothetical protein